MIQDGKFSAQVCPTALILPATVVCNKPLPQVTHVVANIGDYPFTQTLACDGVVGSVVLPTSQLPLALICNLYCFTKLVMNRSEVNCIKAEHPS